MKITWIPTFVGITDPSGICHSCEAYPLEKGEQESIKGYFQRKHSCHFSTQRKMKIDRCNKRRYGDLRDSEMLF
jgi:hypothetical protein